MGRVNREFCPLGVDYDRQKHRINGYFVSEKLDGMRAIWDGGLTRGVPVAQIPWYNNEGDYRLVNKDVRSTGLWSRYGNVIRAPDWWLDKLPVTGNDNNYGLDGELWIDRGQFQRLRSIVSRFDGNREWEVVKYKVFDLVPLNTWLYWPGKINLPNYKKEFPVNFKIDIRDDISNWDFLSRLGKIETKIFPNEVLEIVSQQRLPLMTDEIEGKLEEMLKEVVEKGGEGLILKKAYSLWVPIRDDKILKVKPERLGQGRLIGFIPGEGKYKGKIGSLLLETENGVMGLSGMTDWERDPNNNCFTLGDIIRFKFRELTDAGIPKEARYLRP